MVLPKLTQEVSACLLGLLSDCEAGGSTFMRNVGKLLLDRTRLHSGTSQETIPFIGRAVNGRKNVKCYKKFLLQLLFVTDGAHVIIHNNIPCFPDRPDCIGVVMDIF
jgi:hypothetical protein